MSQKSKNLQPTNQFTAEVSISFPKDEQAVNVLHWFNLQNCGKKRLPLTSKASHSHKNAAYNLMAGRRYKFVFEVTKDGDWIFVGRKA